MSLLKPALSVLALLAVVACNSNEPPAVADWFKPAVDGQSMETIDYIRKYCAAAQAHVNCTKANTAFAIAAGEKDLAKQKEKFAIAFPAK